LNQPAPPRSTRGSHLERSSRNLDYLLEDDEEKSGGAGKIFLILVALALAVGFGYLRWRHEGLSSLMSGPKKSPAVEQQSSDSGQPSSGAAPSNATDASSGSNANPSPSPAPSQPAIQPVPDAAAPPAAGDAAAGNAASGSPDAASSGGGTAATPPAAAAAAPAAAKDESGGGAGDSAAANTDPNKPPAAAASVPKRGARSRVTPKPTPVTPRDPVTEAERYLYGRGGALQDCDRGLRMLRPAADQANPRAMISLGALYATGVCTPRDLPTAYRWFAIALRKQPDNQPLQENLQRLWNQMTQPERQLAIKMSQ
jgi:TPR repeat protein